MGNQKRRSNGHLHHAQIQHRDDVRGLCQVVRAVLSKVPGVQDVSIDVHKKLVVVTGTTSADDLLAAIKKTGKATALPLSPKRHFWGGHWPLQRKTTSKRFSTK